MAVPKRRTTSSRRDMRRANHDRVTPPTLSRARIVRRPRCPTVFVASVASTKARKCSLANRAIPRSKSYMALPASHSSPTVL